VMPGMSDGSSHSPRKQIYPSRESAF